VFLLFFVQNLFVIGVFLPVISLMLDFLLLTMIQLVKKVCSAFRVSATCSRARSA
jgi:hypothetical protein